LFAGGAGLLSTAFDYTRFMQMLLNGGTLDGQRILSVQSVAEMSRNQIAAGEPHFDIASAAGGRSCGAIIRDCPSGGACTNHGTNETSGAGSSGCATAGIGWGFGLQIVTEEERVCFAGTRGEFGWDSGSCLASANPAAGTVALIFSQLVPRQDDDFYEFRRMVACAIDDPPSYSSLAASRCPPLAPRSPRIGWCPRSSSWCPTAVAWVTVLTRVEWAVGALLVCLFTLAAVLILLRCAGARAKIPQPETENEEIDPPTARRYVMKSRPNPRRQARVPFLKLLVPWLCGQADRKQTVQPCL